MLCLSHGFEEGDLTNGMEIDRKKEKKLFSFFPLLSLYIVLCFNKIPPQIPDANTT